MTVIAMNPAATLDGRCPLPVRHPVMRQRWETLSFLHWPYPARIIQRLLPDGLSVDCSAGSAWVGLIPFFLRIAGPIGPSISGLMAFPEINVRTYVTGPGGEPGIYFLSLDAPHLLSVLVARAAYRVPYEHAHMRLARAGDILVYECRRRRGLAAGTDGSIALRVGKRIDVEALTELDHFLTARWTVFSHDRRGLRHARVEHAPWPLHHATVLHADTGLICATGLPAPTGVPLAHYSPGVTALMTSPGRTRNASTHGA